MFAVIMMSKRRLHCLFLWLLATSGLVWQLHFIFRNYFEYPTITEVTLTLIPKESNMPSLTLACRLNVSQVKITTLKRFSDRFPAPGALQHSDYAAVKKQIRARGFVFYNIFVKNTSITSANVAKDNMLYVRYPLSGKYRECKKMLFVITNGNHDEENLVTLPMDGENVYYVSYVYKKSKMLSHPYSNCVERDNRESSSSCEVRCQTELWANLHNLAPIGLRLDVESLSGRDNVTFVDITTGQYKQKRRHIKQVCRDRCFNGTNCVEEFYSSHIVMALSNKEPWLKITVKQPRQAATICDHKPAILIIDFAVYVSSAISFWLGLTPLSLMLDVGNYFSGRRSKVERKLSRVIKEIKRIKLGNALSKERNLTDVQIH